MFLVKALNYRLGLSVRNGIRLLVPVDAFNYVWLLYAALWSCQESKTGKSLLFPVFDCEFVILQEPS